MQWEDDKLRFIAAGEVTLEATQAGNATYLEAKAQRHFMVSRAAHQLRFDPALPQRAAWNRSIDLQAVSDRGLGDIVYSLVSGAATLDGRRLSFLSKDSVAVVRATQAGNILYAPASVEATIQAEESVQLLALNGRFSGSQDDRLSGQLACSNLSSLRDPITYRLKTEPAHGQLSLDALSGAFVFQPEVGFTGSDEFRFCVEQLGEQSPTATVSLLVLAPLVQWRWQGGSTLANGKASLTSAGSSPNPGARAAAATWTDGQGRMLLFGGWGMAVEGGPGLLSDLWRMDPDTGLWSFLGGSTQVQSPRVLPEPGGFGVEGNALTPGGRSESTHWLGADGQLYLFGGYGVDVGGKSGWMGDLWSLDPQSLRWRCLHSAALNANGDAQHPSARAAANGWVDEAGRCMLWGGRGMAGSGSANGSLNDLWAFDPKTQNWSWCGGSRDLNAAGLADGLRAWPSARSQSALWQGLDGMVHLFGGVNSTGVALNDLWSYEPASNRWTLRRAASIKPAVSNIIELGQTSAANWPGARSAASTWRDASGDLWLIGGSGLGISGASGALGDVWRLEAQTLRWSCMKGPLVSGTSPVYADQPGLTSPTLNPGARCQSLLWTDALGRLRLHGGRNAAKIWGDDWQLNLPPLPQLSEVRAQLQPKAQGVEAQPSLQLHAMLRTQNLGSTLWWTLKPNAENAEVMETPHLEITAAVTPMEFLQELAWPLDVDEVFLQCHAENPAGLAHSSIITLRREERAQPPVLTWLSDQAELAEAVERNGRQVPGSLLLSLQLDQPAPQTLSVGVLRSGSAEVQRDYLQPASTVTFLKGQREAFFELQLIDNTLRLDEPNQAKTILLSLEEPAAGLVTLGNHPSIEVRIIDNDAAPVIGLQPQSQFIPLGGSPVTLGVELAAGTAPFTYQWSKNGAILASAKSATMTLPATASSAGIYEVLISNATGRCTSQRAQLCLLQPLPELLSAKVGSSLSLKLTAAAPSSVVLGASALHFQWLRLDGQGEIRVGTDSPTLALSGLRSEDAGLYLCRVSHAYGQADSSLCEVQVVDAPPIINLPETLPTGQVGVPYAHQVQLDEAMGDAASFFSASGLPAGLSIDARGLIRGQPTLAVTNKIVTISARNGFGNSKAVMARLDIAALPADLSGTYLALGTMDGEPLRLDLSVSTAAACSLKASTAAGSVSAKGLAILQSPQATLQAEFALKPAGSPNEVRLRLSLGQNRLGGQCLRAADGTTLGSIAGYRLIWGKNLSPKNEAGYHNLLLDPPQGILGDLDLPQGSGYGAMSLSASTGALSFSGRDALGISYTATSFLGPEGQMALMSSNAAAASRLFGILQFEQTASSPEAAHPLSGSLHWSKGMVSAPNHRTYRGGFDTQVLRAIGGRYRPPVAGQLLMDLPRSAQANAIVVHTQAGLADGRFFLRIDNPSGNLQKIETDPALKLSIHAATGLFTGSFSNNAAAVMRSASFSGMMVPAAEGWKAAGHFLIPALPQAGQTLQGSPILSGQIAIQPIAP